MKQEELEESGVLKNTCRAQTSEIMKLTQLKVLLPMKGWQYFDGGWQDDDTLTVNGKDISCLTLK